MCRERTPLRLQRQTVVHEEGKNLQSWIDRRYRTIWSGGRFPPLIKMEQEHLNMQDIRNILGIKSIQWKIEKRTLERIGHVLRLPNERLVKTATLGWMAHLEDLPKNPGRKQKTVFYWKKILREAYIPWSCDQKFAEDRKQWEKRIKSRMLHLYEWESNGNTNEDTTLKRNPQTSATDSLTCRDCGKVCKSIGGLKIHAKRMHGESTVTSVCRGCEKTFQSENT